MSHPDARAQQRLIEETLGPDLKGYDVTFKPMFGGITAYTAGRNFASLSNVGLALKLGAEERTALLAIDGAQPLQYKPGGPVSKASVLVPEGFFDDHETLRTWFVKSMEYCRTLPARPKRPAKKRVRK